MKRFKTILTTCLILLLLFTTTACNFLNADKTSKKESVEVTEELSDGQSLD